MTKAKEYSEEELLLTNFNLDGYGNAVVHWWNRAAAKLVEGDYWPVWLVEMAEPYWTEVDEEERLEEHREYLSGGE